MSIRPCSNDVSFKSACVVKVFLTAVPLTVVWLVENRETPSPALNEAIDDSLLFYGVSAFTCFALDIDLAKAFVYLEAILS